MRLHGTPESAPVFRTGARKIRSGIDDTPQDQYGAAMLINSRRG